jgi:transcription elongation factor GreA
MTSRWDDLHRAIEARDSEGTERLWLDLVETDAGDVEPFLHAAKRIAEQQGGKRESGLLLWMLAESLKEGGRHRPLIHVYCQLARTAPDDGTLRAALIEAARAAYPQRTDLDALLEKSGVIGGQAPKFAEEAETLERYLQLEPGAYVFHKSGWGAGRVVEYLPERGRCVIDFKDRPGHQMDIDAAARLLERLPEGDIRAMALSDPEGLRRMADERPTELVRQVLHRFRGSAQLRHVKDALVPDAVPATKWNDWWKKAKREAMRDPRFNVGGGRDPRIEFREAGQMDFRAQVARTLKGCGTTAARLKAIRDVLDTVGDDAAAKQVLAEFARMGVEQSGDVSARMGWQSLLARIEGDDVVARLGASVTEGDPGETLERLADDRLRAAAARALLDAREDGAQIVHAAALKDDPALAEVVANELPGRGRQDLLDDLLERIDDAPVERPRLFAWYVKGMRRNRWEGRSATAAALCERVLKTLDAVEYRARRESDAGAREGVGALEAVLSERACKLVQDAAKEVDDQGARHLLRQFDRNRGLKGRGLQRMQDVLLRAHPRMLAVRDAEAAAAREEDAAARAQQVYMTREGIARLKADFDRITNEELPANAAEIARAREFGDLSENAEYHAAREKHALLTARADAMRADLSRATALTPEIVRTDAVSVGTRVRLRDADGKEATYTLLGPPDVDVERGVISYLTPLGQALMGRKPGERVRMEMGGETRDLEVLSVESAIG